MARTRSGKTTTNNNTTSTSTPPSPTPTATTTASGISTPTTAARRRKPRGGEAKQRKLAGTAEKGKETAAAAAAAAAGMSSSSSSSARRGGEWIVYAVASGACAAFNGVFAKLTTNDLTSHISRGVSGFLGLADFEGVLEVTVRCIFFGLNLVFNGVMWTLFTKALARGHSTTQVSIMNTSTNFVVTAVLGLAVFAESLPPLWWAGAAMLVAGNVIIGRKDDGSSAANAGDVDGNDGRGGDDDVESGRASPVLEDAEEEGEGRRPDYGTVTRSRRAGAPPVEKDSDEEEGVQRQDEDEDEDEDVPLLGDLEDSGRR